MYKYYQQGGQQDESAQLMQMIAQAIQQGTSPEEVLQALVQKGIPQEQAQQAVQQVMQSMQQPQQPQMQQGGGYNANGYDVIHPSMYGQMQNMYNQFTQGPSAPSQEQMSQMGANQTYNDVNSIINQRKQLAGKYMNNNAYNYTQQHLMNTPQLRRLTNPQTVMANQTYQKGGTKAKQGMVDMSAGWKDFNINPYREQINSNITPQMFKQYEDYYRNYKTDGKISGTDRANAIMIGGLDDNYYKNVSNITGTDMTRLPGMSSGQSAQYAYGDQAFADAYNQYADQRNQRFANNALNEGKVFSDKLNTSRYQNPLKNLAHSIFHRKKYKNEINNINQGLQKSITDYNNYSTGNYEFQDGGMTDAEAKVFYKNPRYVKSLADAERKTFIGPPNYPVEESFNHNVDNIPFPDEMINPNSIAAITSASNSSTGQPIPQPSPRKIIKKLTKEEIMKMSNKEFAKIADQRMKSQVKVPQYNTNTNYPITSSSSPTMPFQGDRINGTTKLGNKGVANTPLGAEDFLAMSTFLPLGEGVNLGLKGLGALGKYAPNMIKNGSKVIPKITNYYNKLKTPMTPAMKRLATDVARVETRFNATQPVKQLLKNPGVLNSKITGYVNQLRKIGTIESNQIANMIQSGAKNPKEYTKLMKMLKQTHLMDLQ